MKNLPDDALDADRPLVVFLADDTDAEDHAVLFPLLRERGITARRVHPHELVIRLDGARARVSVGGQQLRPTWSSAGSSTTCSCRAWPSSTCSSASGCG